MEEERSKPSMRDSSLLRNMQEKLALKHVYADTVLGRRVYQLYRESPTGCSSPRSSLSFTTRPTCYSSSTSSTEFVSDENGYQLLLKLETSDMFYQEEGANSLRRMTRSDEKARITLCTLEMDSELTREYCVSVLYGLSHGGLRFNGLAREARAPEVLRAMEDRGTERARDKARKILHKMRGIEEDEDEAVKKKLKHKLYIIPPLVKLEALLLLWRGLDRRNGEIFKGLH